MALKFVFTAAAYSALSDEMKPLYIAGDKDGEMKLDVTGMPEPEDTGPLKRALQSRKERPQGYEEGAWRNVQDKLSAKCRTSKN
jgi:hypothetical protein